MALTVKDPRLILLILGVIFDILAVSIPYWYEDDDDHIGIWNTYDKGPCCQLIWTLRGLQVFGLVVSIGVSIFYIVTESRDVLNLKHRRIQSAVWSSLAGIFILVADCYTVTASLHPLSPVCLSISLVAAFCFVFVGGTLSASTSSSHLVTFTPRVTGPTQSSVITEDAFYF